jgi:hypothetical protein
MGKECSSSKFEYLNPKQYPISNSPNSKRLKNWKFEFNVCLEFSASCLEFTPSRGFYV